ncbi:class I SAM-dependent DNA methyltransferase [Roseimaritima sediminicola]|uniref:class I SAM-dependent DNA methyltransferase n=1 Tax=Roseimaritima sediminicola TaxID=2662066 RepID=UPI0012983122|nr:class I SAM-dependent methyltransferase [Roseimaritima sediminicola]
METVTESIYDYPKYYDLVFGTDCAAELKFIEACAGAYARVPVRRMFEPACGTGRLLFHLARRGYEVGGIDLNRRAVQFCNERLARRGYEDTVEVGDMAAFRQRRKWDVAFNTINSFRHLTSEAEAEAHFQCMARTIRKGGLYLLGIHLTPTKVPPSDTESWAARRGHLSINTHLWPLERNRRRRVERFGIRFDVRSPTKQLRIEDELVLRSYTAPQMQRLLDRNEAWEVVETFDFAYDLAAPIDVDASSEDVVYVLRRT